MKLAYRTMAVLSWAVVLAGAGCSTSRHAPPSPESVRAASIPLPTWAPKNPSPEFLRAAKVLKPMPPLSPSHGTSALEIKKAEAISHTYHYPAIYELFGALSDEQVQEFLNSGKVRIPVPQLTASQRKVLDRYFERCRKAKRDNPDLSDPLVYLYKCGAAEDLSNVEASFGADGHLVRFDLLVKGPDGQYVGGAGGHFAYR